MTTFYDEAGAAALRDYDSFFIDGKGVTARSGRPRIEVRSASTGEVVGSVPEGDAADIDAAVAAARAVFERWSTTPREERSRILRAISAGLKERADEIVHVIATEVGMPVTAARMLQVGLPRASFSNAAKVLDAYEFDEVVENSLVVREPIGVVGAITPWNYPLHQIALKTAPALATGCTVVLKPSEVAPISVYLLTEIMEAAGLPPGVFNMVVGRGQPAGERLAGHPDVDMVSFTGSTAAGKRVAALAAGTVKRVALELGGKSANMILDDADMDRAVREGLARAFRNSGQACTALSRMLVPRDRLAEVEERVVAAIDEHFRPGDPFDTDTTVGPLISDVQQSRVREYIEIGSSEGARLVTGGTAAPDGLDTGYYVRPTVLSDVRNDMRIAQEEIFGPVLCILAYDSVDEAVQIANDSRFGLSGAVWGADEARAEQVARRLRTGQVELNGGTFNVWAPFGGYKESGLGREAGKFGFEEYLEIKSIQR